MSRFRRYDIVERSPSYFLQETLMLNPCFPAINVEDDLDLLDFSYPPPTLFDEFDTFMDLIQIDETPFHTSTRRRRELYLQTLCDRVSELELGFDRLVKERNMKNKVGARKFTWTAEVESPEKDRKYKFRAEIKGGKDGKKGMEKTFKWTTKIKGEGKKKSRDKELLYSGESSYSSSDSEKDEMMDKKRKNLKKCDQKVKEKGKSNSRIVEIKDASDHHAMYLKQVGCKILA